MWIDYKANHLDFKVGDFILSFPTDIKFDTFNDPVNYYGIIFHYEKYKFEVMESKIGIRLLISGTMGESKDLPFHKGTAHFLPNFVKVKHIDEFNIKLKEGY